MKRDGINVLGSADRSLQPASVRVGSFAAEELDQFATPSPYFGHSRHPRLAVPLPQIVKHGLNEQHVGEPVGVGGHAVCT